MTRVRSFVQDDSHIYCSLDQVTGEIASLIAMMNETYAAFGLGTPRFAGRIITGLIMMVISLTPVVLIARRRPERPTGPRPRATDPTAPPSSRA